MTLVSQNPLQESAEDDVSSLAQEYAPASSWRVVPLGGLGDLYGGSTPSTQVVEYWDGDIPWLTPSDISNATSMFVSRTKRTITKQGLLKSTTKLLPAGTVLVTSRATIGEVAINTVEMTTNQGFINVVCHKDLVFNEWLAYWIKQNKKILEQRGHGSTFKEISKSSFKSVPVLLPSLPEQHGIVTALRPVRDCIRFRHREVVLEREWRAALMHHLFTNGIRDDSTDWVETTLGEVIILQRGFDLPAKDREPGRIPIVSSSGITGTHSEAKVQGPGVVTGRYGTIGQVFYVEEDFWPLNTTLYVRDFKGNDPLFTSYLLRTLDFESRNDKTSVPGVNRNHLHMIGVRLPPLPEQREIASVLSACDRYIASLEREISLLEELFRGLLEELMAARLSSVPLIAVEDTR